MAYETGEEFTKSVLKRCEDIPDPRLREVMQSAIKHLHAFVSEVKPTGAEWFKAIEFLTAIGHKCDDKRQEFILAVRRDGREHAGRRHQQPRASKARRRARSKARSTFRTRRRSRMAAAWPEAAPGIPCFVTGTVRGLDGRPVAGAILDLWQTDGEGLYEEQRRTAEPWMRGIYRTAGRRLLCDPHRRADQLHDPDGRPDRRADGAHRHEPHAPGAHPFRDLGAAATTAW